MSCLVTQTVPAFLRQCQRVMPHEHYAQPHASVQMVSRVSFQFIQRERISAGGGSEQMKHLVLRQTLSINQQRPGKWVYQTMILYPIHVMTDTVSLPSNAS